VNSTPVSGKRRRGDAERKTIKPSRFSLRLCVSASKKTAAPVYNGSDMELFTWDSMPKEELNEFIGRKIVSGEKAMVAQVFIAKGGVVPEHHHEAEQITYIMEGALQFHIEGKDVVVGKGQVLLIPSNVPHSAVALEDTLDLDIFSPIRYDWLNKTDDYLRKK
jgi:quercetin dioxygenase-like cupin family protein